MKSVLVTGAAGFIGVNLVRKLLLDGHKVLSADALTYAGRKESLGGCLLDRNHEFIRLDITDHEATAAVVTAFSPDWIFHLAAETHVDRSITGPMDFLKTNVLGTGNLLQATLAHWKGMEAARAEDFRFVHVSTDEVFGTLEEDCGGFTETSPYRPRSPYAASKAGSDHAVRAWGITYGLPVIVTNSTNNYGPCQFPEKLIPTVITRALNGQKIPVYGDGRQSRDWIHVEDHCRALGKVAMAGKVGETYLIGGRNEWRNIDLVALLCDLVAEVAGTGDRRGLIEFVTDRPGHDFRYAVDDSKTRDALGWKPERDFMEGLRETVEWYCSHPEFHTDTSAR
ncbi:MAG: dTDP-glucose 4,6-dehydratase [Verrucomicrobiota bacterium]|jgi:dTDP-glucose 4,6-dehydratase